jgi:intracellular sulfur oxidation DsrE/DsrF family protein
LRTNSSTAIRIRNLARARVTFAVCNNSLKHLNIQPEELVDEAKIVPAGVSELVKKQADGWTSSGLNARVSFQATGCFIQNTGNF